MLGTFCLRLACGLIGSLLVFSPSGVNPRFYRVQFLTAFGLVMGTALVWHETGDFWLWLALGLGMFLAFLGSVLWSLEGAPGGRLLIVFTALVLAAGLWHSSEGTPSRQGLTCQGIGELSSAALLGTATTAMLMGHSYLIAPTMSLTPLLRLLTALFVATALRMGIAGFGLWVWTAAHSPVTLDETVLWLPLRWGLGFAGPLILGWMAREAAKIRSTQSATGILYVVVIFCFLGELTGQVLLGTTGYIM